MLAHEFIAKILPAIKLRHPAVAVTIEDSGDDHIFIVSLHARTQSLAATGHAFLHDLLAQTDLHEIVVELDIEDMESRHGQRLVAFYNKFGFVEDDNGRCMRLPEPVSASVPAAVEAEAPLRRRPRG